MKKLLLFVFIGVIFQSCEDTETNFPALQATINNEFFKAFSASAIVNEADQSLTITGLSTLEELILHTVTCEELFYQIAPFNSNYASFMDTEGNVFDTDTQGGSGTINITFKDEVNKELTGKFDFISIRPGIDTLTVKNGFFYRVPYTLATIIPD